MNLVGFDYVNSRDKALVEQFIAPSGVKKYILGINKLTKSVLKHMEVDGIIDDFTRVQSSRKKEILRIEQVEQDAIILSVSTGSPLEVKKRLDELGLANFNYLAFYRYAPYELEAPPFMADFAEDFKAHLDEYAQVYALLEDATSREVFEKVLNFKISFDFDFMEGFSNSHALQYFDKTIIPEIRNIRFVDGGGYVGDTATEVIKNFPDFAKIYLIEPNAENLRIAKRELGHHEKIAFYNCGLSNTRATLTFNDEKSFSSIYGKGTLRVEVDSLDKLISEPVDFIKLDIEGAELEALEGAAQTIARYRPVLAVCVYHKAEDWYKVPQKVLAICPDYAIYLRHYMEGIFETVMYFIPRPR